MDYYRIYKQLIDKGLQRQSCPQTRLSNTTKYFETHHIIPKCLNGSDSDDNLVQLTYREHLIAHWLLWKAVKLDKLFWAFSMMSAPSQQRLKDDYTPSSIVYDIIKRHRKDVLLAMVNDPNNTHIFKKFRNKKYFINVETQQRVLVDKCDWDKYDEYPWKPLTKGRVKITNVKTGQTTSVEPGNKLLNDDDWEFTRFLNIADQHYFVVINKVFGYRWILRNNDPKLNDADTWQVISTRIVNTDTYENVNVYLDDPRLKDVVHWACAYETHRVFRNVETGQHKKLYATDPRYDRHPWIAVNAGRLWCLNKITGKHNFIVPDKFDPSIHEIAGKTIKNADGSWAKIVCPHCGKLLKANYAYYYAHGDNCIHNPANPNYRPYNPEKHLTKGRTWYQNKDGDKLALLSDDPRVLSGEYVNCSTNKIMLIDLATGRHFKVNRRDPKLQDSEHYRTLFSKGTFPYRNKETGEIKLLAKDDPLRNDECWVAVNKKLPT